MSEHDKEGKTSDGGLEGKVNAVTALVKAVPIYEDAIQPLAQEAGKALGLMGRTVNAALIPVRGMVWGIEKIEEFVTCKVAGKLKDVPVEDVITPKLSVAGPVLESLRFNGDNSELCEMYASLLASSMNKNTAGDTHPGFVELIRNMCSDEAKLLAYFYKEGQVGFVDLRRVKPGDGAFVNHAILVSTGAFYAGCEDLNKTPSYVINLQRLGLVEINKSARLAEERYNEILEDENFKKTVESLEVPGGGSKIIKYIVEITPFGKQFCKICLG